VEDHAATLSAPDPLVTGLMSKLSADAAVKQPDYDSYARFYDYFELAGNEESEELNIFLDELFRINEVKSVIDLACGTGAQSIGLARKGYIVTASDLSSEMLAMAAQKAGKKAKIKFIQADMRDKLNGNFDAALCIFNAIGHLTSAECRSFFKLVHNHLNPNGIFVFDILNFCAMQAGGFKQFKKLRKEAVIDGMLVQHVRSCKLDKKNRQVQVDSLTRWQDGVNPPGELNDNWQMQIYDSDELKEMLADAGFSETVFFGATGTEFEPLQSETILAISQR